MLFYKRPNPPVALARNAHKIWVLWEGNFYISFLQPITKAPYFFILFFVILRQLATMPRCQYTLNTHAIYYTQIYIHHLLSTLHNATLHRFYFKQISSNVFLWKFSIFIYLWEDTCCLKRSLRKSGWVIFE